MVAKSCGIKGIVTLSQLHGIVALDSMHVMWRTYVEKVMRCLNPSMLSRKGHLPSAFFISTSVHGGSLGDGKMVFKARIRGNIVEEFFWLREAVFILGFIQPTEKAMAPHSCTLGLENPMDRGA